MLQVESYTAGFENFAYIAVVIVIYVVRQIIKMKNKDTVNPYVPVDRPVTSVPEMSQKEVYYDGNAENDWSYASEPDYVETIKKSPFSENDLERAIDKSDGDLYQALAILKEKQTAKDQVNDSGRFEGFKIKKKGKNVFADLLDDSENFKNAFILSEILKTKY